MDCPRVRYPQFNDTVEAELAEHGYKVMADPSEQVDKVIQLYEVMMTRHTTMVVGQTGGGKTVILNTLARSQVRVGVAMACLHMCTMCGDAALGTLKRSVSSRRAAELLFRRDA